MFNVHRVGLYDNDSSDINDTSSMSGSVNTAPPAPPVQQTVSADAYQTVPLCSEDASAIYDLHMAYHNSLEVNGDEGRDLSRTHANLSDLVNIAELSVRRVIAMAKQVPAFRALPQVCPNVSLSLIGTARIFSGGELVPSSPKKLATFF